MDNSASNFDTVLNNFISESTPSFGDTNGSYASIIPLNYDTLQPTTSHVSTQFAPNGFPNLKNKTGNGLKSKNSNRRQTETTQNGSSTELTNTTSTTTSTTTKGTTTELATSSPTTIFTTEQVSKWLFIVSIVKWNHCFSEDTNTFSSPELGQTWRLSRPSLQAGSHCHRGGQILETHFQTNFKCTWRCKLPKKTFPVLRLEFERHRHRVRRASWSCRLLCGAPDRHILYFKDTLGNGNMTLNKGAADACQWAEETHKCWTVNVSWTYSRPHEQIKGKFTLI